MANAALPSMNRWSSPNAMGAAPTLRAVEEPASYRIYTPEEMRVRPVRRTTPPVVAAPSADEAMNVRTLLKWMGFGIVAGLAILGGLLLFLELGDDVTHRAPSESTRSSIVIAAPPVVPTALPAPVVIAPPPAVAAEEVAVATPAPQPKKKGKRRAPKPL